MDDFAELINQIFEEVKRFQIEIETSETEVSLTIFSNQIFPEKLKQSLSKILDDFGADYCFRESSLTIGER